MPSAKTIVFKSTSRIFQWVWVLSLLIIGLLVVIFCSSKEAMITLIIFIPTLWLPFILETHHEIRNGIIYTKIPRFSMQSNGDPSPYMSIPIADIVKVDIIKNSSQAPKGIRIWINDHKVDSRKFYIKEVNKMLALIKEHNADLIIK